MTDGSARRRKPHHHVRCVAGAGRHPVEPRRLAVRRAIAAGVSPGRHARRRIRSRRDRVRRRAHDLSGRLGGIGADPVRRRPAHAARDLPQRDCALARARDHRRAAHCRVDRAGGTLPARLRLGGIALGRSGGLLHRCGGGVPAHSFARAAAAPPGRAQPSRSNPRPTIRLRSFSPSSWSVCNCGAASPGFPSSTSWRSKLSAAQSWASSADGRSCWRSIA